MSSLSWFSGPGCCSGPGFHLHLGASDCPPGLAFCFIGPLDICLDLLTAAPLPRVQKRDAQHKFLQHRGGAHANNQHKVFQTEIFLFSWTSARLVRAKMLGFFQDLDGMAENFGRMSAGTSDRNVLFGLIFRF